MLLIADEVICGFGRAGNWLGHQTFGLESNTMLVAKGLASCYLPISGVMLMPRIVKVMVESGDWHHDFTYFGQPFSAAVALKNIEILEGQKLNEPARSVAAATSPIGCHRPTRIC